MPGNFDIYPFVIHGKPNPQVVDGELKMWPIEVDAPWYRPTQSWNIPNPEVASFAPQLKGSMGLLVKLDDEGMDSYAFGFDNTNDAILFKLSMNP